MKQFETNLVQKSTEKFECKTCDYSSCRKSQYNRHLLTTKHQNGTNKTLLKQKSSERFSCCQCETKFNSRSTLWRHKQLCNEAITNEKQSAEQKTSYELHPSVTDKDLILMLMKQNSELMEIIKNGSVNNSIISNSNNTNCNNKAFNLNVFLNETCKNAMNMTEFMDSIQVQLKDLERFGEIGYVESISNIITSNLKQMDVTIRPVHCTDQKRETIYIKDDNKWEKEDDKKSKLRKLIKRVEIKNHKLLPAYREKYPGCQYAASEFSDKYNKMMVEVMGGAGNNDLEKEDKIIRNISKNVIVDKD